MISILVVPQCHPLPMAVTFFGLCQRQVWEFTQRAFNNVFEEWTRSLLGQRLLF